MRKQIYAKAAQWLHELSLKLDRRSRSGAYEAIEEMVIKDYVIMIMPWYHNDPELAEVKVMKKKEEIKSGSAGWRIATGERCLRYCLYRAMDEAESE